MAKRIREREISSVELVSAHLERIERIQPRLNAVVEVMADEALRAARSADAKLAAGESLGLLHGVPISVKDSINVAGSRCTAGTLGFSHAPPAERDATLVSRLRNAGAIPIAKTICRICCFHLKPIISFSGARTTHTISTEHPEEAAEGSPR